jgi:gluconolactonase
MIFARGLGQPETPVLLEDGSWLVVEMDMKRGCVTRVSPDGAALEEIARTGRPQGVAVGRDGVLWVAESHPTPSLVRIEPEGEPEVMMTECDGRPLLLPNDLVFGPDGALYMTDSGILFEDWAPGGQLRSDYMDAEMDGRVFRIEPDSLRTQTIDDGLRFANGIAFSPDGELYANEMITGCVYRYPKEKWGTGEAREVLGNVIEPGEGFRGPDGMAFDGDGLLYVAVFGQQDVTVLDEDGGVVRRIRTEGRFPTNVAFGPRGSRTIFVTEAELGQIEAHEVACDGAKVYP